MEEMEIVCLELYSMFYFILNGIIGISGYMLFKIFKQFYMLSGASGRSQLVIYKYRNWLIIYRIKPIKVDV